MYRIDPASGFSLELRYELGSLEVVGNAVAQQFDPKDFNAVWYIRTTKFDVPIGVPNDGKDYMG